MVFHPEAGWGGLPTRVQKQKYLETDKFVTSTRQFQKKPLAGAILWVTFGGNISKTIWRDLFQKTFSGNFKKTFGGKIFKNTFGGNILARTF
jgi:hypothetical protein